MDLEKAPSAILLEEVFNEVDGEILKESKPTKAGFLEDLISLEKEILAVKKKSLKNLENGSTKTVDEDNSAVHEGLTDSSDDEENKYFEERKYNDCGRLIKNLIKHNANPKSGAAERGKSEDGWHRPKSEVEDLKKHLERFDNASHEKGSFVDPILGMRIINPLVSSASLKEKSVGRISISTLKLKKFVDTPAHKDANWITGGAIVHKLARTSKNGNQYCIWHLTDLAGDIKRVCVLLFGSAYKEYWKTGLGAVVGILNPVVMNNKENTEATLRVDNAHKILLMGMSQDYGLCKSRKKTGESCSSVVNKSKSEYCVYHIKKEYNKACRRSDLQPPKIGRSLDNLRAKVLGKSQVFYGGKTFTGVPGKKSLKQTAKDEMTMKLLSQRAPKPLTESRQQRDKGILNVLSNSEPPPAKGKETPTSSKPAEPKLVDLAFTISKKERNAAKANALKYVRDHGPLKKYSEKTKRTHDRVSSLKRKLEAEEPKEGKKAKTSETPADPSKQKYSSNGITDEFLRLMNSETRNAEALKVAESDERDKYFDKLETREKMEEKMASTFKVECKAVRCLKCNYKSFSASDLCKKEKHPLKVVKAIKRFWKCGNCFGRTVCLELIPLHSCKVCGSSKWERASMLPEKKNADLVVEKLSLRGDEEKFIGAAMSQANINLLVPEEGS